MAPWQRWFTKFGADLLSVIPHGARSNTIAAELIGKVPGHKLPDGTWVGDHGPMADRAMTLEKAKQAHRDGAAIGVLGRNSPGLDIDVSNEALAQEIQDLAFTILGGAPCRGREGSPRRLLMYKGKGLRRRRLEFRPPTWKEGEKPDAIELLGAGQYYNVEGLHPSGKPYAWGDLHPCEESMLIEGVNEDAISMLFEALPAVLARHECVLGRQSTSGATGASAQDKPLSDASLWHPDGPAPVLAVMKADPNEYDYDAWVEMAFAFKAALGPDREDYYGEFEDWSAQSPVFDAEKTRKLWESIETSRLGWRYLNYPPETEFDDAGEAEIPDVPDPGDTAIESMLSRYRYIREQKAFADLHTRKLLDKEKFDATRSNQHIAPCGTSGTKAAHSMFIQRAGTQHTVSGLTFIPGGEAIVGGEANLWRPSKHKPIEGAGDEHCCEDLTYLPGAGAIVGDRFNTWRPSKHKPIERAGDPVLWLEHVRQLFPVVEQREHFLGWCAWVLQRPGVKINHAMVLLTAVEGRGKDCAILPLLHMLDHNYTTVTPTRLTGLHTEFLRHQLIYVPEMMNYSKGEVACKLREWLAAPPPRVSVRELYRAPYEIPNSQAWIFTTNLTNAIILDPSDRRYWVPDCDGHEPKDKPYWTKLWNWLKGELAPGIPDPNLSPMYGCEVVAAWLMQRDISAFDAGIAPTSETKQEMIEESTPFGVRWLNEQFAEGGMFHGFDVITPQTIKDEWGGNEPLRGSWITQALKKHAFKKAGVAKVDGKAQNTWTTLNPSLLMQTGAIGDRIKANKAKAQWRAGLVASDGLVEGPNEQRPNQD